MRNRALLFLIAVAIVAVTMLASRVPAPRAEDVAPGSDTGEEILGTLRRTLAWYQRARVAMESVNDVAGGLIVRDDEQTVTRALQRAFDVARARASLLARSDATARASGTADPWRERRAKLDQTVRESERELERARAGARAAPARRRAALEREVEAASRRLELDRLRLDFVASMEQAEASLASGELDIVHQIQALQESVPEVAAAAAPSKTSGTATATTSGDTKTKAVATGVGVRRLLALQRVRNGLDELTVVTRGLTRDVDGQLASTQDTVRQLAEQLRADAGRAAAAGAAPPVQDEAAFRAQLGRLKGLTAVVAPLRTESILLHRIANDLEGWKRALGRESRSAVGEVALDLAGVAVALIVILIGALLWRVATVRYVGDPSWRRLSLTIRNVVAAAAVALVIVFHFTSELTALVTALGFAAAGIAFALQTVILSVAGYFSMVAPHGIRVGDRVSLQGPFGYVHGEVLEIGFVRIRLRELSGDGLQPTGRIVVFPNSVVFTGSFFKHPPGATHARAA